MKNETLENRIMNVIRKEKKIDLKIAKKYFRNRNNVKMDDTIMRTVRKMAENGELKRIERGVYR